MAENQEPISEQELARRRPKRKVGCVALGLIAFVSFVACVLLALFFWNLAASRRLNDNLAKLKQSGYATNFAELQAAVEARSGDHAGPLFVAAGNSLARQNDMSLPFIGEGPAPPPPGNDWDQLDAAKAFLAKVSGAVESLHQQAQSTKPARYDIHPGQLARSFVELPYTESHRQACRVLTLAAYVHAHEGRNSEIVKCVQTSLRIANSLVDEPSLMAQQLSLACMLTAKNIVKDFIDLEFTDAELATLQQALRSFDPKASFTRGLEAETVTVLENFQNPRVTGPLPRKQDAAFFIELTLPLLDAAAHGSWPEVMQRAGEMKEIAEDVENDPTAATRYMLTLGIVPALEAMSRSHARAAAHLAVVDALIATRRFHLRNGRLPESIDQLVPDFLPEVPLDPLSTDAQPLNLMTVDGRTKIYSVGLNRVDDQGFGESGGASIGPLDIVMELSPIE